MKKKQLSPTVKKKIISVDPEFAAAVDSVILVERARGGGAIEGNAIIFDHETGMALGAFEQRAAPIGRDLDRRTIVLGAGTFESDEAVISQPHHDNSTVAAGEVEVTARIVQTVIFGLVGTDAEIGFPYGHMTVVLATSRKQQQRQQQQGKTRRHDVTIV